MIREFTKDSAKMVHEDVRKEVNDVLAKYGLTLGKSIGRYSATEFTVKLTAMVTETTSGTFFDKGKADFERYAPSYDIPKEMLGRQVVINGKRYKIIGWNNRSNKYKVLIESSNGKKMRATPEMIASCSDKTNNTIPIRK